MHVLRAPKLGRNVETETFRKCKLAKAVATSRRSEQQEMNAILRTFVVVAAGLLVQQSVVVAAGQEVAPAAVLSSLESPNSSNVPLPAVGSKGNPSLDTQTPLDAAITKPGRAEGTGDPALGGERHPLYRLHKSDVLEVSFTFSPEYDQTVTIQPDGRISLKHVGSLFVEGLSLPDLTDAVRGACAGTLHDPEVSIALKDFEKPYFIATGEVARPGKYELRSEITVNEAVAMAGGFTKQSKHSQVVLFRRAADDLVEARVLNLKQMLNHRNLSEDMHLRPGDLVYVPQSQISKIQRFMPTSSMGMYMSGLKF